jgi:hypothetical protein
MNCSGPNGIQTRSRRCDSPEKENHGDDCQETPGSTVTFVNGSFGLIKIETQTQSCFCSVSESKTITVEILRPIDAHKGVGVGGGGGEGE